MRESIPLYHQLKADLLDAIESGQWQPNQLLPSEPELARKFGVSRTTVRLAIGDLAASGYVVRKQGRGTYVAERTSAHASRLYGFAEDLRRRHPDVKVGVLRLSIDPCPTNVAVHLQRQTGTPVIAIHRLAKLADRPVFFEKSYLTPPYHTDSADVQQMKELFDHVYGFFERNGVRVGLGRQSIRAAVADAEDARILGATPGEPVLVIVRTTQDESGSPIEFSQVRYLGALYEYEVNLTREP